MAESLPYMNAYGNITKAIKKRSNLRLRHRALHRIFMQQNLTLKEDRQNRLYRS
jgi:DNA-binding transcriptional regulator/RsmH inhibitor MraZ